MRLFRLLLAAMLAVTAWPATARARGLAVVTSFVHVRFG